MIRLGTLALGLAVSAVLTVAATAQNKPPPPPSNAPSPAEKDPLSSTTAPDPSTKPGGGTAMPRPDKSLAPPEAKPGAAPVGSDAPATRQSLVPDPSDPGDVDTVTLPAKPAAILSGKATKENVVAELQAQFTRIEAALGKAGIAPTGRPLAVFTNVENDQLQYDAMIPVAAAPSSPLTDAAGLRFGSTPSGKAYRFRHSGPYEQIAGTYDVLSTFLDTKDIAVQDPFIEEYLSDLKDGAEDSLEVNIYALAK